MKRCLNCRKTYEDSLSECPHCGYKPRSKTKTRRLDDTQDIDISSNSTPHPQQAARNNIRGSSRHAGSFYLRGGEKLNKRYSVINVMGYGAFGVAYECFDNNTQMNVVVKEYMPSYLVTRSQNGRDVEPLSDEAEVTFSIGVDSFVDESKKLYDNEVSCVPKMLEYFKQNNTSYVVTELVHGESLNNYLRRKGRMSYQGTITIITSVLQGLRQLNKVGIIHGDICPDNIIITSQSDTVLLDYNLSDFNKNVYTQRDCGKLRAGYSALEMYYMNMEQGPWTDVYAAAATMYKMLTGITVPSAIKRKTSDTVSPPSKLGIAITPGAEKAMMKSLKVDYEKRTQNPEDFLNGLMGDGFDNLSEEKNNHRPVPKPAAVVEEKDGNKILNTVLVFLIIAIIGVAIWLFISGVFALPDSVSNILPNGNADNSDTDKTSSITSSEFSGDFYEDTESEESNEGSSEDSESKGLFDDILSKLTESKKEEVSSYEESSEESYYDNSSYYYDDYSSNYEDSSSEYYYDDYSSEYGDGETSSNSLIDDVTSSLESTLDDVASSAGEYLSSFFSDEQ